VPLRREPMSWTTPVVVEICAGLEVTAYVSAEM
jgi:coenzyme PQQ precursor peptide PqqA